MNKQMSLSAYIDELAQVRTKKKEFLGQINRIRLYCLWWRSSFWWCISIGVLLVLIFCRMRWWLSRLSIRCQQRRMRCLVSSRSAKNWSSFRRSHGRLLRRPGLRSVRGRLAIWNEKSTIRLQRRWSKMRCPDRALLLRIRLLWLLMAPSRQRAWFCRTKRSPSRNPKWSARSGNY